MNSLLDRLLRLRLAASLPTDDGIIREKRIVELRSLLDEIAVGRDDVGTPDQADCDGELVQVSSA